jgi:hypothetical protein
MRARWKSHGVEQLANAQANRFRPSVESRLQRVAANVSADEATRHNRHRILAANTSVLSGT